MQRAPLCYWGNIHLRHVAKGQQHRRTGREVNEQRWTGLLWYLNAPLYAYCGSVIGLKKRLTSAHSSSPYWSPGSQSKLQIFCSKKNAQITNFRWRINLMSLHVFSFLNGPLVYASKFPSLPNWKRRLESNGAISRIPKGKKLLSESFHALQTTILTIDPALQQYLNLSLWSPLCW